jgi:hypothetical protein
MLEIITPRHTEEIVDHRIEFTDEDGNGCSFECDENGKLFPFSNECAEKNYKQCMEHPELFAIYNEHKTYRRTYTVPAVAKCHCGAHVSLYNQYMGACECEECGRWYNLFGQELIHPDGWEDEDYDY